MIAAWWRSGLTLQFAKLSFVGSTPTQASLNNILPRILFFIHKITLKTVDNLCFMCINYNFKSKIAWT